MGKQDSGCQLLFGSSWGPRGPCTAGNWPMASTLGSWRWMRKGVMSERSHPFDFSPWIFLFTGHYSPRRPRALHVQMPVPLPSALLLACQFIWLQRFHIYLIWCTGIMEYNENSLQTIDFLLGAPKCSTECSYFQSVLFSGHIFSIMYH